MNGTFDLAAVSGIATTALRVISAVHLRDVALLIVDYLGTRNQVGIA